MNKYLKISKEVQNAINNNIPIVALESTIISHGMPYPKNLQTALECEQIVRDNGCVPATIAIIKGKLCIGLEKEDLEYLAYTGLKVTKASRRDIPVVVAKGIDGATTVSATMYIASLAGIKVFATGGIGGVHRGAEVTMDISADLDEFVKNINENQGYVKTMWCGDRNCEDKVKEANVDAFGEYLNKYRDKTQFIIITHKKKTMEFIDTLYGITMQESGVSKLVSVKLDQVKNTSN